MKIPVDGLFFIGMQLVAISNTGKVAVWQSVQRHWQLQDVEPICSYDAAGSFLLLGCANGSIYYIGEWTNIDILQSLWVYKCNRQDVLVILQSLWVYKYNRQDVLVILQSL